MRFSGIFPLAWAALFWGSELAAATLGFEGCPDQVLGTPGKARTFDVFATLTITEDDPSGAETFGWDLSMEAVGGTIVAISVDGIHVPALTWAGPTLDFNLVNSWHITALATYKDDPVRKGAVFVILVDDPIKTLRFLGTRRIARITVSAPVPSTVVLRYEDGFRTASGQPVNNRIIFYPSNIVIPEKETCTIQVRACGIGDGPDCNSDGIPDTCELEGNDCDRDGIPDDCELDCDSDGIPDPCEVLARPDLDSDRDGIPDSCEDDCNSNGTPDDGDIASGSSRDCNSNGVPDECDLAPSYKVSPEIKVTGVISRNPLAAQGDLDGDGILDILVNRDYGYTVLFGNGDGTFNPMYTGYLRTYALQFLGTADLDGDGDIDFLIRWPNSTNWERQYLYLLRNDGKGKFSDEQYLDLDIGPGPMALADFDLDGDIDFVQSFTKAILYLNHGNGTFEKGPSFWVLSHPMSISTSLVAGHLNDDEVPDLISLDAAYILRADILLSTDKAAYGDVKGYTTGVAPAYAVTADLDRDGHQDLAIANAFSNDLSVYFNQGDGSMGPEKRIPVGEYPNSLAAVDLDLDGDMDLAVSNKLSSDLSVLINDGAGRFGIPRRIPLGEPPAAVLSGDFTGDGAADLAVVSKSSVQVLTTRVRSPRSADLDGNGVPDECEGGLQLPGDANQDGRLDIADPVRLLGILLHGSRPIPCDGGDPDSLSEGAILLLDSNGDGQVDISDPVHLIAWIFLGGPSHALGTSCRPIPGCPAACGLRRVVDRE